MEEDAWDEQAVSWVADGVSSTGLPDDRCPILDSWVDSFAIKTGSLRYLKRGKERANVHEYLY